MGKLYRKILRLVLGEPTKKLSWSVEDFNTAKSYAKRLDHPNTSSKSLWEYLNNPWNDSVDILQYINQIIDSRRK